MSAGQTLSARVSRSVLNTLVRCLPSGFRAEYADDLLADLDEWKADRSAGRRFGLLSAAWFLLRLNVAERLSPTVYRRTLPHPARQATMGELLLQDARSAVRSLAQRPGYTLIALLTLAVGVGANTAIFSIVDTVVLKPLDYPEPERLVRVRRTDHGDLERLRSLSQPDVNDLGATTEALDGLVGFSATSMTWVDGDSPVVLDAAEMTDGLLGVFGVSPVSGRDLRREDNVPNGAKVVVVAANFAQQSLGGGARAVGSSIQLDGDAYEVVGVAPAGFDFPAGVQVWVPLYIDEEGCGRGCRMLTGVGRLADSASVESLNRELSVIATAMESDFPASNRNTGFHAQDLQKGLLGETRQGLLLLLGAVLLVLLVCAANLACLQVARSTERRNELRVRSALGADRSRVWILLVLETLLLGAGGGVLGIAVGSASLRSVMGLAPGSVPRLEEAQLDLRVLLFAFTVSIGASLLFSVVPAWRAASGSLSVRSATQSSGDVRTRNLLLVAEIALSLVLLVGAGLLLRTYDELLGVDLGFDPDNVKSFMIALPEEPYETDPQRIVQFSDALETSLLALPGVESAGGVLGRPLSGNSIGTTFRFMDEPPPEPGMAASTRFRVMLPGYFETMRIPMLDGRGFQSTDRREREGVVIVNRKFFEQFSADKPILGRQMDFNIGLGFDSDPQRAVVGVVESIRGGSLTDDALPEVFVPQAQMAAPWMSIVVRGGDAVTWQSLESTVQQLDPHLPLHRRETMTEAVDRALGPARFYLVLLASFSGIAIFLAAIGLYGVVSYVVSQRTRELAVRQALGAEPGDVMRHVLKSGGLTVGAGVAVGAVASLLGSRVLETFLYQVNLYDPITYGAVIVLLVVVALLSLAEPALRAARVSPAQALRD